MLVLGIESSCDETGVALYDTQHGLLAHALHSQVAVHEAYGGVVPELASREHIRYILPITQQVLRQAQCTVHQLSAIAYTQGPGLAGALLVGASFAESLAFGLGIPALGIHHLEGHLLSPLLEPEPPSFPFVALLVSGGHTQLLRVRAIGQYELLGDTRDDAVGEAFDKTAQLLGLPYPGGPHLAKLAEQGGIEFTLPRPLIDSPDLDFSFSGLKTAVLRQIQQALSDRQRANLAWAFQEAVSDVLSHKAIQALQQTGLKHLVVSGGVGANLRLREKLAQACQNYGFSLYYPRAEFCTDNGVMIAFAGAMRLQHTVLPLAIGAGDFSVYPRWNITAVQAS